MSPWRLEAVIFLRFVLINLALSWGLFTLLQGVTKQLGPEVAEITAKVDEYARGLITTGERATMFEELGLYYIGPVNGHNMRDLVDILREVKDTKATGPVLLHVMTEKVLPPSARNALFRCVMHLCSMIVNLGCAYD